LKIIAVGGFDSICVFSRPSETNSFPSNWTFHTFWAMPSLITYTMPWSVGLLPSITVTCVWLKPLRP